MIKAARIAISLVAITGVGATFAACGGVPGNAVATVDGESIDKDGVQPLDERRREVPGPGQRGRAGSEADYTKCVAAKRKSTPAPAKGQPKVDRRAAQDAVQDGVRAAAQPGPAAADPLQVDPGRGRREGASRSPTPRSRSPSTSRRSRASRRKPTTRSSSRRPARPRRTSCSASSSTCCRTRSATRSSRARTRSPTRRSPTSTTRTRPASRSPRSVTCASC